MVDNGNLLKGRGTSVVFSVSGQLWGPALRGKTSRTENNKTPSITEERHCS